MYAARSVLPPMSLPDDTINDEDDGASYRKACLRVGSASAVVRVVGVYTGAKSKSLRALVTMGVQSYIFLRALYSCFSRL